MPEIDVDLCGHRTTIACAPDDEPRLRQLIGQIAERADAARSIVGDNDRWRQLLFAAIFLADELDSGGTSAANYVPESENGNSAMLVARIGAALDRIDLAVSGVETARANA
jgi:cell division protein ZapA (FtsZ GTPase activity inhibitor)